MATMGAADTAVRSPRDYLRIYLSDHHAACRATVALGRRVLKSNEGSALGTYLADRLVPDLERDLSDLENVMRRLGFGPQRWKDAAATAAERVGRLKPNGQIRGYSPLSRVLELEGLELAITGTRAMWKTLSDVAPRDPRLVDVDFDGLIRRADEHCGELRKHHEVAVRTAFPQPA